METIAVAQKGVSPKLLADVIVSLAAFAVAYFGVDVSPELAVVLAKAAGLIAGVIVGPGRVVVAERGPASDDLLPAQARRKLESAA